MDWTGNYNSVFKTLGASNHSDDEREHDDYYATEPKAAELLLSVERLHDVWECACGENHLSDVFAKNGVLSRNSDLINRCGNEVFNFLSESNASWNGDIVTNPPYKYAAEFVYKALSVTGYGDKVCMFLKLTFMEGKTRKKLFLKYPPKFIYVSSSRLQCAKNADFKKMKDNGGGAVAYAWYKGFKGDTVVRWIN